MWFPLLSLLSWSPLREFLTFPHFYDHYFSDMIIWMVVTLLERASLMSRSLALSCLSPLSRLIVSFFSSLWFTQNSWLIIYFHSRRSHPNPRLPQRRPRHQQLPILNDPHSFEISSHFGVSSRSGSSCLCKSWIPCPKLSFIGFVFVVGITRGWFLMILL